MYENFDGSSPDQTEGAEKVTSRVGVEPEDGVSFADHNECLKRQTDPFRECKGLSVTCSRSRSACYLFHRSFTLKDLNYPFSVSRHLNKSLVMTSTIKFNCSFCVPQMKPHTCVSFDNRTVCRVLTCFYVALCRQCVI